jgi:hypothetical protein
MSSPTYTQFVELLHAGVGWARGYFAERYYGLVGVFGDYLAEGAREAVYARLPTYAAPDALPQIGTALGVPRFPPQTEAQYRSTLGGVFALHRQRGTRQAVLAALSRYGLPTAELYEDHQWFRPPQPWWSQFWIYLPPGTLTAGVSTQVYDDGSTYDDGQLYDVTIVGWGAVQVSGLRAAIRWAKRGASICREIIIQTAGIAYNTGATYDDGSLYNGAQVVIGGT